jgi:hypothetical protein
MDAVILVEKTLLIAALVMATGLFFLWLWLAWTSDREREKLDLAEVLSKHERIWGYWRDRLE